MRPSLARRTVPIRLLGLLSMLAGIQACAARGAPPVVVAPSYPDFVFPAVPQDFRSASTAIEHEHAWQFLQAGDLRTAERRFAATLRRSPQFYPAETGLGYVELARRNYRDATGLFDRALAKNARYPAALVGRGQALEALGQTGEALQAFEAALAVDASLGDVRRRVDLLTFELARDALAAARRAVDEGRYAEARSAYELALVASPDSPLLYRELAVAEQQQGLMEQARVHAQRSTELDGSDVRAWILLADLEQALGNLDAAEQAYSRAYVLEATPDLDRRLGAVRARIRLAKLPPQYRAIPTSASITRGELAALVGVRFEQLLQQAPASSAAVITDLRGHWAAPWIFLVSRGGVMDVYPNHTFQPETAIRRGDFASVISRVLGLIAAENPRVRQWQDMRYDFADLTPSHLSYPAAAVAVLSGAMPVLDGNTFQLNQPVSGAEAAASMDRLEALAEQRP